MLHNRIVRRVDLRRSEIFVFTGWILARDHTLWVRCLLLGKYPVCVVDSVSYVACDHLVKVKGHSLDPHHVRGGVFYKKSPDFSRGYTQSTF